MDKTIDSLVTEFVKGIQRGPLRCLAGYTGGEPAQYVEDQNPDIGDIYACAVFQAYLDMCRTVSGASKGRKKRAVAETRSIVAETLRHYFKGKPKTKDEAFDGWYASMAFQARAPARLTVGQVQKLFNMAFKYLYCCEDFREKYQSHFALCHMPLDSYTLAWYKRECDPDYDGEAWSAIDDNVKYFHIVSEMRQKLKGKIVLEEEFSIWAAEKARIEQTNARKAALKVAAYDGCPEELRKQLVRFSDGIDSQ